MSITIRKATKQDIAGILEIINYEISHTKAVYHYQEKTYQEQFDWFEVKQQQQMPVFVAESENKIVGYASYGIFRPFQGFKYSIEHSIYVKNTVQGLGIGNLLIQALIEEAKKQKFHTMIACIDSSNEKSILFHQKRGFQETGRLKQVGFKFDEWLDLVIMQLIL